MDTKIETEIEVEKGAELDREGGNNAESKWADREVKDRQRQVRGLSTNSICFNHIHLNSALT